MPWRRFLLGLALGVLCLPAPAHAILIEVGGVKVGGYFQSDDGKKLTIRSADGKIIEYDHAKIKVLHDLDRKLLATFSKDDPSSYFEYAEKLARQIEDPEAKDTAMRLFLIAAHFDQKKHGHQSLLGMSALASTPAEFRKCRALAFLLNPTEDAKLLKTDATKPLQLTQTQAAALRDFLKALHYYRAGQIKEARVVAKKESMDKIFGLVPGMVDQKVFLQWLADAGKDIDIPDDNLRIVLRAEVWAVDRLTGGNAKKGFAEASWSAILESRPLTPVLPLSLETITEFNPRECLYRNGRWVAAP